MPREYFVAPSRLLLPVLLLLCAASVGRGATFTWTNAAGNGNGNWDTLSKNWSNSAGGSVAWTNGGDAFFGSNNAGSTITPDAAITVHSMTIDGDGYVIAAASTAANTITLGSGASPYIGVYGLGSSATAYVQTVLAGTGGLAKQGDGFLELDLNDTYTGATTVSQGVLRLAATAALPGGTNATGGSSNLNIAGGIVELSGMDFNRSTGTLASQMQWTGSGGFAAFGNDQNVNLGGGTASVTWGSGGFVPTGQSGIPPRLRRQQFTNHVSELDQPRQRRAHDPNRRIIQHRGQRQPQRQSLWHGRRPFGDGQWPA